MVDVNSWIQKLHSSAVVFTHPTKSWVFFFQCEIYTVYSLLPKAGISWFQEEPCRVFWRPKLVLDLLKLRGDSLLVEALAYENEKGGLLLLCFPGPRGRDKAVGSVNTLEDDPVRLTIEGKNPLAPVDAVTVLGQKGLEPSVELGLVHGSREGDHRPLDSRVMFLGRELAWVIPRVPLRVNIQNEAEIRHRRVRGPQNLGRGIDISV